MERVRMAYKPDGIFEYILIHYRWIFVCLFLLPISFSVHIYLTLRNWIKFKLYTAPNEHESKVQNVQNQVKEWIRKGRKQKLCTSRPGWQTMSLRKPLYKKTMHQIDVNLADILEINTEKKTVRVEPLVTMGQLTAILNPLGWTIPVMPEIDDLTVGGLVMGTGIESSSHRYGLFQHICISYEMVICNGEVVRCSSKENSELFYSIPWSYGTLGFLTAVEVKIIPAKKYIKLTYWPLRDLERISEKIELASKNFRYEFVEAIIFNKNEAVLMTGKQVDEAENSKINSIGKWYKPWFFLYVKNMLEINEPTIEYIPLRHYYHRHTKSFFWELQHIIPFGNNTIFRFLLGWLIPPKISILKLTQTKTTKKLYDISHVIQDILVPIENLKESIEKVHDILTLYPIWICPFKLPGNPGMVHPPKHLYNNPVTPVYVDIGIYGIPQNDNFSSYESVRKIEKYAINVHGYQMLYADSYMTKEEFRRMFDHDLYDKLRMKLKCDVGFMEVYDKVKRSARE